MEAAGLGAALPEWTIVREVGSGGEKQVFEALTPDGQPAALKLAPASDRRRTRMERELRALNLVESPHLVRPLTDVVRELEISDAKYLYYAEEFVPGQLVGGTTMPWTSEADVVALGRDLARAVEALWRYRIVHRDIKPDNVIRHGDGRFILLDPGLARHQDLSSVTGLGGRPGTPLWYSPEQIKRYRRELDFRSDLFLVGQLLFFVATGVHPYLIETETEEDYERRVLEGDFPRPSEVRAEVTQCLERVITRLLSPTAHGRYRSIERLQKALDEAESGSCT